MSQEMVRPLRQPQPQPLPPFSTVTVHPASSRTHRLPGVTRGSDQTYPESGIFTGKPRVKIPVHHLLKDVQLLPCDTLISWRAVGRSNQWGGTRAESSSRNEVRAKKKKKKKKVVTAINLWLLAALERSKPAQLKFAWRVVTLHDGMSGWKIKAEQQSQLNTRTTLQILHIPL